MKFGEKYFATNTALLSDYESGTAASLFLSPLHAFTSVSLFPSLGLSFLAATTGRAAPSLARSSPATTIRQVCPPVPFPSCRAKPNAPNHNVCYLYSDLTMTMYFAYKVRSFLQKKKIYWARPCSDGVLGRKGSRFTSGRERGALCSL